MLGESSIPQIEEPLEDPAIELKKSLIQEFREKNGKTTSKVRKLMVKTFPEWIVNSTPGVVEILQEYPAFKSLSCVSDCLAYTCNVYQKLGSCIIVVSSIANKRIEINFSEDLKKNTIFLSNDMNGGKKL